MITQHAWMFLSSYEKLRTKLFQHDIVNMAHLGARAFEEIGGEVVQTTSFVLSKRNTADFKAAYVRLVDYNNQQAKEEAFLSGSDRYSAKKENFEKIPGSPVAYWVSENLLNNFDRGVSLSKFATPRTGIMTGDNSRFLRLWWEVFNNKINFVAIDANAAIQSNAKWFPYNKGGEFRKWYGNDDYVVDWENGGAVLFGNAKVEKRNAQDYPPEYKFQPAISWSLVTTGQPAFRVKRYNLSDIAGPSLYTDLLHFKSIIAFCNSVVSLKMLRIMNPTINFQGGNIGQLPIFFDDSYLSNVNEKVDECIQMSKDDWDSFETSWDFKVHPLVQLSMAGAFAWGHNKPTKRLRSAYKAWELLCEGRFNQLKTNEEELNRIFIDIYGLQDELTPEVEDKDVTVYRIFDSKEDIPESMAGSRYALTKQDVIKSFISYAVGCMFGRYSLDTEGLAYAGGGWDSEKYKSFIPDKDNVLPICDDEYFDDDILGRFYILSV